MVRKREYWKHVNKGLCKNCNKKGIKRKFKLYTKRLAVCERHQKLFNKYNKNWRRKHPNYMKLWREKNKGYYRDYYWLYRNEIKIKNGS